MTMVTKSYDDSIYKLVPIEPTDEILTSTVEAGLNTTLNGIYCAMIGAVPTDLPGVITHSGEPVAYSHKNFPKSVISKTAKDEEILDMEMWCIPLFAHPPQVIEAKPTMMMFFDLPLGTVFRYVGITKDYVVLDKSGAGLVAVREKPGSFAPMQQIFSAFATEKELRSTFVEVDAP